MDASAASPPCAVGSVSGPRTSRNSTIGSWPPVRDEQWQRVGRSRARVVEVHPLAVDRGFELRQSLIRARPRASRTRRANTRTAAADTTARCRSPIPHRRAARANGCERDAPEDPRAQRRERRLGTAKPWFDRCTRRTVSRWPRSTPSPRAHSAPRAWLRSTSRRSSSPPATVSCSRCSPTSKMSTTSRPTGLGIISGASFIASLIGLPPALGTGRSQVERSSSCSQASVSSAVSLVLFALSSELWQFTAARALGGLAIGCYTPATRSIVARTRCRERRPQTSAGSRATELGGFVAGPVVGAAFASAFNLDAPFLGARRGRHHRVHRARSTLHSRWQSRGARDGCRWCRARPTSATARSSSPRSSHSLSSSPSGSTNSLWSRYLQDRGREHALHRRHPHAVRRPVHHVGVARGPASPTARDRFARRSPASCSSRR
jgi:hypothetical protein